MKKNNKGNESLISFENYLDSKIYKKKSHYLFVSNKKNIFKNYILLSETFYLN